MRQMMGFAAEEERRRHCEEVAAWEAHWQRWINAWRKIRGREVTTTSAQIYEITLEMLRQ